MSSNLVTKLELGVPCSNSKCGLRASCERFYDPDRKENQGQPTPTELVQYDDGRDTCHLLRRRLHGTPEVHREWNKTIKQTTKRRRTRGGCWT